jgi:hypothetical protein
MNRLKWCTHLYWFVPLGLDISPIISGMISLQELTIDGFAVPSLPLEYFPNLTSLTIERFSLAPLAKIQHPLLLFTMMKRVSWQRSTPFTL